MENRKMSGPFFAAALLIACATPGWTGEFKLSYGNPKNPRYVSMQREFSAGRLLDDAVSELNRNLKLPYDIPISFKECGFANAFYSPMDRSIKMCFEIADLFTYTFAPSLLPEDAKSFDQKLGQAIQDFDRSVRDAQQMKFGLKRMVNQKLSAAEVQAAKRKINDALVFTFYHEVGHALVHNLDIPVTGKEEDAVDQLASHILIGQAQPGQAATVNAASGFLAFDKGLFSLFSKSTFADEHSLGRQRFYNILCWVYGSDQARWGNLVVSGTLPNHRAERCPHEYSQLSRSWDTLLASHRRAGLIGSVAKAVAAGIAMPAGAASGLQQQDEAYPTEGDLNAVRAALAVYATDHQGKGPMTLEELTVDGKYLTRIPGRKFLLYDGKGQVTLKAQD